MQIFNATYIFMMKSHVIEYNKQTFIKISVLQQFTLFDEWYMKSFYLKDYLFEWHKWFHKINYFLAIDIFSLSFIFSANS